MSIHHAIKGGFALAMLLSTPAMAQSLDSSPSPSLGAAGVSIQGISGAGIGGGGTEARATAGSGSINSVNVDDIARTGDFGAATSLGGSGSGVPDGTTGGSTGGMAGRGPDSLYNIPSLRIAVDLSAIRAALAAGSNATPKSNGN